MRSDSADERPRALRRVAARAPQRDVLLACVLVSEAHNAHCDSSRQRVPRVRGFFLEARPLADYAASCAMLEETVPTTFCTTDIPSEVFEHFVGEPVLAFDTETSGLSPHDDALLLVQVADRAGHVAIVQHPSRDGNLSRLLGSSNARCLFHFARFDVAFLARHLGVVPRHIGCTKIAARIVGGFDERTSLESLARGLLGVVLDKSFELKTSNWGAAKLTEAQLEYAARDVLFLPKIWEILAERLDVLGRMEFAEECFAAVQVLARADALGLPRLFDHH